MIALGRNKHAAEFSMKLCRPLITALVPSSTGKGLDVLRISQHEDVKGKKHLVFQTYVRSANAGGKETDAIWDKVRETSVFDALASRNNGQYFHIKFIRASYELKRPGKEDVMLPAILEVFSWYGVLGVRLFAAGIKGWDYEQRGQQPFLGQTSIMSGLGSMGDWGYGILPWSSSDSFVDVNVFLPKSKDDLTKGHWGMVEEDFKRPYIEGWDVGRRPLRKGGDAD